MAFCWQSAFAVLVSSFTPKVASFIISKFAEWAEFYEYDLGALFCIFGEQDNFFIFVEHNR